MSLFRFGSNLAIFVTFAVSLWAQTVQPSDLDSYAANAMKVFEVPGMAVAIVKDGKIIAAKGYGVRRLSDPTPVDEYTQFGIASMTKAFTTAALATLVDAGKLTWDDPVYQRLPGFVMSDAYLSHEETVRDLLTHFSGLGGNQGDLLFWPRGTTYTREEIIYKLRFMKPASSFRSRFGGGKVLLYLTAGQIIPAVTGISWDDYIRQHIFAPIGMNNSSVSNIAFKAGDDHAFPHSHVDGKLQVIPFEVLDNVGPAGSINSCATDLAKWMQLQLNHGNFADRDGRLFGGQQSKEMWSPQMILPIDDLPVPLAGITPSFAAESLGWNLQDYHGRKLVGHPGEIAGFFSRMILVPEEKLGVVMLSNAEEEGLLDSMLYHVLDYYFGLPPTDWIAAFKSVKDTQEREAAAMMKNSEGARAVASKPSLPLQQYAGAYNDAWYGPIAIRVENKGPVITFGHTPSMIGDLQHWQYDTFKAHWRDRTIEDAFITFALKQGGSIGSARMAAVSPLADSSYDYEDLLLEPAKKQ